MTAAKPLRVAAYARMSTDDQPDSIDRQRHSVARFADREGLVIQQWFTDEAVPGDEVAKRPGFRAMLDAASRGQFDVILADALDRLARLDPFAFGAVVLPLREAGVRILTVTEGTIDLAGDPMGVLMTCFRATAAAAEARKLSQRVTSSFFKRATQAMWSSTPPYGYSIGPDGRLAVREDEAKVVRFLYDHYLNNEVSLTDLVVELHERGVPPRRRTSLRWSPCTIQRILSNPAYVGQFQFGRTGSGKYTRVTAAGPKDARRRGRDRNSTEMIVIRDAHPPVIDQAVFDQVQRRLRDRRKRTAPYKQGGPFLLSGLLHCGRCGSRMIGTTVGRTVPYRVYVCGLHHNTGGRECSRNTVRESKLWPAIARKLRDGFLNPDALAGLRAEIAREAAERPDLIRAAERRVAELDAQVERATRRLFDVAPDLLPEAQAAIRSIKRERVEAGAALDRLRREAVPGDELLGAAERLLWRFRSAVESDDTATIRGLLADMVRRVEVRFETRTTAKGLTFSRFAGGVIQVADSWRWGTPR